MRIADLQSFNGAPRIDVQWSLVSVHECETEEYDISSEDKVLVGMLVSMKHSSTSSSNNIKLRYGGMTQNSTSRTSSFMKLRGGNMNVTYDRLFFFADMNTPGKCFVILTETVHKSDFLMSFAQQNIAIGDIFAIIEPDQVVRALQGDLPLINTSKPLYPLLNCPRELVPLVVPETGKQRYFCLEGVLVQLSKVEAVKASCTGTLCDRQNTILQTGSCGCLYFNRTCSVVLDMTVTFKAVDANGYENQYSVPHFRSWRTSKIFIHPTVMTADNEVFFAHTREIRQVATNTKNVINNSGGWTIVGWYRKGEIIDASALSNNAGSEIASDNHPIHISYLYPTNPTCLAQVTRYPRGESGATAAEN
jgi:hypothetical protein